MRQIMTVCGIQAEPPVGICQCHEHLMIRKGQSFEINPALFIDDTEKTISEVQRFHDMGGTAIVDAQPGGCGRMAASLHEIALQTKTNIIASTGFHKAIFYPKNHWIHTMTETELNAVFSHELNVGMYKNIDTAFPSAYLPYRAGIIKAALDTEGLTPLYQKLFRACAFTARQTKVPLMIHIEKGSNPIQLCDFLIHLKLSPKQLIFCHLDRATEDLSVHRTLLMRGCYLDLDTIGRFKYHNDDREIEIIQQHLSHGYEDQIMLSLDTTRERLRTYNPKAVGLDYILTTFIPLLRKSGFTEAQIRKLSHDNFIKVFTQEL